MKKSLLKYAILPLIIVTAGCEDLPFTPDWRGGGGGTGGGGNEQNVVNDPMTDCSWTAGDESLPVLSSILMRNLSWGEGQQFRIEKDGKLAKFEAAIWAPSTNGSVVAEIFLVNGEYPGKLGEVELPNSAFPHYNGIHSENRYTMFRLRQPIEVRRGDVIDIVFKTTGSTVVSGIHMFNKYPGKMVFYNGRPGLPNPVDWDYIAQICVK